ncbi:hypothetical protein KR018_007156 [Drosophila ironensis]|nr:hypothetical protein KR018_007156 [Drosophila ironensis]
MKNSLWNTLQAVEQVEVSFNETLQNIKDIGKRYKTVSSLKKKAQQRQNSYEAEISAAITTPTFTKIVKKKAKKNLSSKKKNRKPKKKAMKLVLPEPVFDPMVDCLDYIESPFLPLPDTFKEDSRMGIPELDYSVETNCVYEVQNEVTNIYNRRPYQAMIRRLYRAARQKSQKDSNTHEQRMMMCVKCSDGCYTNFCSCTSSCCACG